jgi:serine/threonine protein kinase
VLHQIGVGALGPVFRTYEPTRDRLVAVKVFRLDVTPEQAIALADELGRVTEGNLFHPSIVEPVAAGVEGTVAYRAEEYVAAESLDVAMRHYAPAALDTVLPFITQLASAIDFARQAGVGHGALHPRDIFVTPDEARATGFGVVDALDRLGLRAPVRRPYSPPERIAGERWGTPADVFSLAAIAFELITGRRPLGLGDQIGPLSGTNVGDRGDAIRAVLVRAMREHPVERYATALEFTTELGRAAGLVSATPVAAPVQRPVDEPAPSPTETAAPSGAAAAAASGVAPDATDVEEPAADEGDAVRADTGAIDAGATGQESLGLGLTLEDSPREVARKVIAARKRQGQAKAKAHGRQDLDAAVSLLVPPDPVPESSFDAAQGNPFDTAQGKPFDAAQDKVPEPVERVERTSQFDAESDSPESPRLEVPDDPAVLNTPIAMEEAAPKPEPLEQPLDEDKRVADLDEFRPREREIDAFRAERPWLRAADRTDLADLSFADLPSSQPSDPSSSGSSDIPAARASDSPSSRPSGRRIARPSGRPTFRPSDLPIVRPSDPASPQGPDPSISQGSDSPSERAVMPKPTALEPFDPELPPPLPLRPTAPPPPDEPVRLTTDEAPPAERPRVMMLPTAVGLLLGLLGGYLAGYSVGSRDANKPIAQTASSEQGQAGTPAASEPTRAEGPRAETPASAPTPAPSTQTRVEPAASATRGQSANPTTPTDARVNPAASERRVPSEGRRAQGTPPPVPNESSREGTPPAGAPTSTAKAPAATPPAAKPEQAVPSDRPRAEGKKPEAATTTGRIIVSSTPSRAAVTVNGIWSGRTPLTLADRPFGNYSVRVVEPGYTVARQDFVLSSSAPTKTIEVTLEPTGAARGEKPAGKPQAARPSLPVESKPTSTAGREQAPATTGSIFVDSRPQGARVFVDGKDYGVTPLTVPGLTLGQHTVRLELADHAPWTKTETVTAGTTARVTGSLERIQ